MPTVEETFKPLSQEEIDAQDDTARWVTALGLVLLGRIWLARDADSQALEHAFVREASLPDDSKDVTAKVSKTLSPATPGGNYAARRIVQTEATRAFGQATKVAARANPIDVVLRWEKSSKHTGDDICDKNAAGHSRGRKAGEYLVDEFPSFPGHPNCQCFMVPVLEDPVDVAIANILRNLDM